MANTFGTIQKYASVLVGEFAGEPAVDDASPQDILDQLLAVGDVNLLTDDEYSFFADFFILTPTNDDILQYKAGAWTNSTVADYLIDLGLDLVDNTADLNKPISNSAQTALDLKAPLASPVLTGNPTAPTQAGTDNSTRLATTAFVKNVAIGAGLLLSSNDLSDLADLPTALINLGLDLVDNTADADKPISTDTQTALNAIISTIGGLTTDDIAEATNKNYVTDTDITNLGNLSGSNSGDDATNTTSNSYADALITQVITNGVTNKAPSEDVVYDALALKVALAGAETITGLKTIDVPGGSQLSIVPSADGNPTYVFLDNTINSGGKAWRVGHTGAIAGYGSFDIYNQTDDETPLSVGGDGVVSLPVGQLKFPATQNPSSDANTLDDYEEGTFTPDANFGGASVGMAFAQQYGSYTKIGRKITCQVKMRWSAKGSSTGVLAFTGLPFTVYYGNIEANALSFGIVEEVAITGMLVGRANGNTTGIFIFNTVSNGAAVQLDDADMEDTSYMEFTVTYFV